MISQIVEKSTIHSNVERRRLSRKVHTNIRTRLELEDLSEALSNRTELVNGGNRIISDLRVALVLEYRPSGG